jgi:adenylosuccinate synthase
MPYHMLLDHAGEAKLGKLQIGTTRRGIGPCYADKAARLGIRVQDLLDEKILKKKIVAAMEPKRLSLRPFEKDPRSTCSDDRGVPDLRPPPRATHRRHSRLCGSCSTRAELVIFEGAQGALLDIDHGTYPFVTSSNPIAGAACVGAGVGPKDIDEVWGVTEGLQHARRRRAVPERARRRDGRVDPRARRRVWHDHRAPTAVGWLDLVALRYAAA